MNKLDNIKFYSHVVMATPILIFFMMITCQQPLEEVHHRDEDITQAILPDFLEANLEQIVYLEVEYAKEELVKAHLASGSSKSFKNFKISNFKNAYWYKIDKGVAINSSYLDCWQRVPSGHRKDNNKILYVYMKYYNNPIRVSRSKEALFTQFHHQLKCIDNSSHSR